MRKGILIQFDKIQIKFKDKLFCFTGIFSLIHRKDAQLEVKKRGGIISKIACDNLDYLIIGNKPSPSWKHGFYGNKIEEAYQAKKRGCYIYILSEDDFVSALKNNPAVNDSYNIKEKLLIINFQFTLTPKNLDYEKKFEHFCQCIAKLKKIKGLYIKHWRDPLYEIGQFTINGHSESVIGEDIEIHKYRFMKLFEEKDITGSTTLINIVNEKIKSTGIEGIFKYYERQEGSSFQRLKSLLPQKYRIIF